MTTKSCRSPSVDKNKNTNVEQNLSVKGEVRRHYGELAKAQGGSCGCTGQASTSADQCCGSNAHGLSLGYSVEDLKSLQEKALSASAGCGNPTALADLKKGETVLDLGSG